MFALTSIVTFVTNNLKWIAIILAVSAISLFAWRIYGIIIDNGLKSAIIATQKSTIETQNILLEGYKATIMLSNQVLQDRDDKITEYETMMDGAADNLGADANDLAPLALRELMRRLK